METDARIFTRTIDCIFRSRFNLEFVRRLNKNQPVVADWPRIAPEEISIEVHSACHLRRGDQRELSLAIYDVQIAREHRLAFLHNVYVRGALLLCGEYAKLNSVTGAIDGSFCA